MLNSSPFAIDSEKVMVALRFCRKQTFHSVLVGNRPFKEFGRKQTFHAVLVETDVSHSFDRKQTFHTVLVGNRRFTQFW